VRRQLIHLFRATFCFLTVSSLGNVFQQNAINLFVDELSDSGLL